MSLQNLKNAIKRTQDALLGKMYYQDKDRIGIRLSSYNNRVTSNIKFIEEHFWKSTEELDNKTNLEFSFLLKDLKNTKENEKIIHLTTQMEELLKDKKVTDSITFKKLRLPSDIQQEVEADLKEVEKCYNKDCYRSAIILCGRLLEIALHRKYFETTGKDLLETNPGIGIGTLVKKLVDKDVKVDPGLMQQIHLINNTRNYSVHKKKEPFLPSKAQTQATILFTLDAIEKLF